jgi:hypothetical protein
LATARRIKTAGRPRQPLLRRNRRCSSPQPFGRAGLARFEPRRLVSTSERRLPGENVCYLRNLGTDEPLTSMNGMARGRAASSLSPNQQNRRNREPTRTGSRSGSCTDPRHRPTTRPGYRHARVTWQRARPSAGGHPGVAVILLTAAVCAGLALADLAKRLPADAWGRLTPRSRPLVDIFVDISASAEYGLIRQWMTVVDCAAGDLERVRLGRLRDRCARSAGRARPGAGGVRL